MDTAWVADLTCEHGVFEFTGKEICLTCVAVQAAIEAQCLIHGHNMDYDQCLSCGWETPEWAAYQAEMAAEYIERGALAGSPREMECHQCPCDSGKYQMRKVVALGPVIEQRRDPTQTYDLECGHMAI